MAVGSLGRVGEVPEELTCLFSQRNKGGAL
jgi:hypothetical protein